MGTERRKRVLDVGNCSLDHAAIRCLVEENFAAEVVQTHAAEDTLKALRSGSVDLVLVNRKLDRDDSNGLELIQTIKSDPHSMAVPVMLITNFADQQQLAVDMGAEPGFGKSHLEVSATVERLKRFLA